MTQEEWEKVDSARPLLEYLQNSKEKISDRRWRLLACAAHIVVRAMEINVPGDCKWVLQAAYAVAEARTARQKEAALLRLEKHCPVRGKTDTRWVIGDPDHQHAARCLCSGPGYEELCAPVVRDIIPNPFWRPRPVSNPPSDAGSVVHTHYEWVFHRQWVTPDAARIAQAAYKTHDFRGLPILADAVEEAGCTTLELLAHLRGPGPHYRGCWALDWILGKE